MQQRFRSVLAALALGMGAATMGLAAHAADVKSSDQIKADYNAAKEQCKAMSGNQQDACEERAKAARTNAEADAKVGKAEAKARQDVAEDRREADYDAAKAQCDTLKGDAEDKCRIEAKTKYGK